MDDLMDMIVSDEASASDISDKIKEILYAKATERIDSVRPSVGSSLFGDEDDSIENPDESDEIELEKEISGNEE
jgi:hypothetical protein|tara:strand:- start:629 stop:850 length:222 start_codon:yes stop_codon:yes gene_type:complete